MKYLLTILILSFLISSCSILAPQKTLLKQIANHGYGTYRASTIQDFEIIAIKQQLEALSISDLTKVILEERLSVLMKYNSLCAHGPCGEDCCPPPPPCDRPCLPFCPVGGTTTTKMLSYEKKRLSEVKFINSMTMDVNNLPIINIPNTISGVKVDFSEIMNSSACYDKAIFTLKSGESFEISK